MGPGLKGVLLSYALGRSTRGRVHEAISDSAQCDPREPPGSTRARHRVRTHHALEYSSLRASSSRGLFATADISQADRSARRVQRRRADEHSVRHAGVRTMTPRSPTTRSTRRTPVSRGLRGRQSNGRMLALLFGTVTHMLPLPAAAQGAVTIGLDHIPVAVRDLERASGTYRALGFVVK